MARSPAARFAASFLLAGAAVLGGMLGLTALRHSGGVALAQSGPSPVVLTSPANNAAGQSTTLTFSWQASSSASLYNLYVVDPSLPAYSGRCFGNTALNLGVTSTSYTVPSGTFFAGHTYFWAVYPCTSSTSCNYAGATAWSFTTAGTPAAFATLSTPTDTSTNTGVTPTLSWTAPSDAASGTTQYTPVLYDPTANNNAGGFLGNLPATTSLSASVPSGEGLQAGHSYQWTLDACTNGNCSGPTSHWFTFTTSGGPGNVTLLSPSTNATGVSTTPTLSWSAAPNAVAGTTQYIAGFYDPYGPPAGHMLGSLPATTSISEAVSPSEGLFWGQGYFWSVTACTGLICTAPPWSPFSTAAQPAVTASGALPQQLPNPDFSGQSGGNGVPITLPGWTAGTGSYTSPPLGMTFPTTVATSGAFAGAPYDVTCSMQGGQSVATFAISYSFANSTSAVYASYNTTMVNNLVFSAVATSSSPLGVPQSQLFSIPSSLGSGHQLVISTSGGGTVSQVQRTDIPAPGSAPHSGLSAEPRFPKAVGGSAGNVDVATGTLGLSVTDLDVSGVAGPLRFNRSYSSQTAGGSLLGAHWGTNWDTALSINGSQAMVSTPDSGSFTFTSSGTAPGGSCSPYHGVWVPEAGVDATLTPGPSSAAGGPPSDVQQVSYVLTTVSGRRYTFSGSSAGTSFPLTQVADRNGNTQTLTYLAGGGNVLSRVTDDGSGRWLQLSYRTVAGVVRALSGVSDSSGRSVSYTQDAYTNDLTSVTDVRGKVWHYAYGQYLAIITEGYQSVGNHWLASVTDPLNQQVLRVAYDLAGHVQTLTDAANKTLRYVWGSGAQAGTTVVTDQNVNASTYYWDIAGRLTDAVDATQVRQSFAFDVDNNVVQAVTSGGNGGTAITLSQAASYDRWGNTLTIVDGLGYTTSTSYQTTLDTAGNLVLNVPLSVTDPLNHTTTNTYDGHGNVLTTVDAVGHTVATNTYNARGQLLTTTNANTHTVTNGYNASTGDRTSVTDALGKSTTTTFDSIGQPTSATDPLGHVTSITYDSAGNVLTAVSHAGSSTLTTTTSYDDDGRKHSVTDPNNHATTWGYDVRGLLSTVTDANNGVTTYGYDPAGNRTSVTDANGKVTSYSFDAANRPLSETDPKTNVLMTLVYDVVGRVHTRTDARGVIATYSYDPDSHLLGVSYSGGGTSTPSVAYTYDAAGNRLTMLDATGTTSYLCDADNRPVGVTNPGNKVVGYSYDNAGNRASIVYPSNEGTVTYGYDQDERLASVTDWLSHTTQYQYDDASRLTTTTLPASTGVTSAYTYDESNRLLSVTHSKGGSTLFSASYALDNSGNRTGKTTSGSAALNPGSESYTLDNLNRLTVASYPGSVSQTYSYDPVGNRTSLAVSGGSSAGTTSYTLDSQDPDRLVSVTPPSGPTISYGYDTQGNTTSRSGDTLSWDGESRLVSGNIAGQSFAASYNGDGLRTSRTVGSTTTNFVWDFGYRKPGTKTDPLPLLLDDGTQYVYGSGLTSRIVSGTAYYYLADGLGSTAAIVDGSGTSVQQYGYDAYGNTTSSGGAGSDFQYAGQQTDPTGLQYLRARYYDPATGRFLSRDPLAKAQQDPAQYHPYLYGMDNPVLFSDPAGTDVPCAYDPDLDASSPQCYALAIQAQGADPRLVLCPYNALCSVSPSGMVIPVAYAVNPPGIPNSYSCTSYQGGFGVCTPYAGGPQCVTGTPFGACVPLAALQQVASGGKDISADCKIAIANTAVGAAVSVVAIPTTVLPGLAVGGYTVLQLGLTIYYCTK